MKMDIVNVIAITLLSYLLFIMGCSDEGSISSAHSAQDASKEIEKLPVVQILLDVSERSPGTSREFINSKLPEIEKVLTPKPLGTTILVSTFGDRSYTPITARMVIQLYETAHGAPVTKIVQELPTLLPGFLKQVEGQKHKQSNIITSFFEASRHLNPKSEENEIIMISDLLEVSALANCEDMKAKAFCVLPAPEFKLPGTKVTVFGVGSKQPSNRVIALTKLWETFLTKAGVSDNKMRLLN